MIKKQDIKFVIDSILHSYSKVFFAENKLLGLILVLISFFDYWSGLMGMLAVITVIIAAKTLKFDEEFIQNGALGFNSLLIGLGIGLYFQVSINSLVFTALFALLGLFLTMATWGFMAKYALPFLSIPFLIGMWIVTASFGSLDNFGISERGIYSLNELYSFGGVELVNLYQDAKNYEIPHFWLSYFLSLGAIFFQFNILAGIIIAIGLLIYSRIAFTLSILGFSVAYAFYFYYGISPETLSYTYIGFNFILTAIALGAFYLVPSRTSYLWIIILLPISVIITLASSKILTIWGLPIYSLPFNLVVLLFLYVLKLRTETSNELREPVVQKSSPEANLYYYQNNTERFYSESYLPVYLPVIGNWYISQGQKGEHTHKGEWQYAWDFIINDEKGEQFNGSGDLPEDYYCFGKPAVAPAEGKIIEILDGIDDNIIGEVNMQQNWGNTVIIEHSPYLYSQLSHLKKDSIKVQEGDFVKKGQKLAQVGNSGRSPYPHLHAQFQITQFMGSKTFKYPFAYYVKKKNDEVKLQKFGIPNEGDIVANSDTLELLRKTFQFKPGQRIKVSIEQQDNVKYNTEELVWQVQTSAYNIPYLYCEKTKSYAYFDNDEQRLLFFDYDGDTSALLYKFFLSFYNIHWVYYPKFKVIDSIPANYLVKKGLLFFHDFVAAFKSFIRIEYRAEYIKHTDDFTNESIDLETYIESKTKLAKHDTIKSEIHINSKGEINWKWQQNNKMFKAIVRTQ